MEAALPEAQRRRAMGTVMLTAVLDLVGFGIFIPLMTFYAESFSATPEQVTMLMAIFSLAQFVFAPLWGQLSDRIGRRPVLVISIGLTALFLALFASASSL
ncbi:MAG TPA: MFS transporter, partial [Myxococcota bacterium]|nr:MFS transporter [Myxococcota bacterium]